MSDRTALIHLAFAAALMAVAAAGALAFDAVAKPSANATFDNVGAVASEREG